MSPDWKGEGLMNKLLIAGAGLAALLASPAMAADMPLKARPAPVAVVLWTGGYIGVGVGGEWARTEWTTTCFTSGILGCGNPLNPLEVDTTSPHNFHTASFR